MSSTSKRKQISEKRRTKRRVASVRPSNTKQQPSLSDVLDAAERLDFNSQSELVAVLSRRLKQKGRERLIASVAEARREFSEGKGKVMTASEIIREAMS